MQTINFAVLAFGKNTDVHAQAAYALLSTMAYSSGDCNWIVVTDAPEFYSWFGERVQIINASPQQLIDWRGKHDFFWRIKIEAVRMVAQNTQGHVIYMDSDIVANSELSDVFSGLDSGNCYMHKFECQINKCRSTTVRRMWRAGKHQDFAGYSMDENAEMWNAGIIAIPAEQCNRLDDVLASCDSLLETSMPRKLFEQYSFSRVLQDTGNLKASEQWFLHYWGNKEAWLVEIRRVLDRALLCSLPLQEVIEIVRNTDINLPVYVREPWAERTWKKLKRHIINPRKHK